MKKNRRDNVPLRLRLFTWLNISVQTVFPVAYSITPSVAVAKSEGRLLEQVASPHRPETKVYILKAGESVTTVASKFNMTVDGLRKLNFAQGFDRLQPGDELYVPLAPLPAVKWDDIAKEPQQDNAQQQKLAGFASQAGSTFATQSGSDAATSMALGMFSGEVGNHIQQWLSQFGTARVQLDVDKNITLKNSQLDLLAPLYDQDNNLVFTQGSLHRTDDRAQANLGIGLRQFQRDQMLGSNIFFDYDLSRNHARMGVGAEYWRDFVKLGANGYLRLTNWRDSADFNDYEERPANGWDLRSEFWLPAWPQLGGKLMYEQYYGQDVALFGKDNRQNNPHAFTAGINYTPFPLVTLSAELRQGKSGENDSRLGVQMTYQPGVPWHQQMEPDAVRAQRSLVGSRYDLVSRNNNIVLEYRKKEVIRLHMTGQVTGYAGETKSLNVSVNSKYGLERINWSAPELLAAGGRIVSEGIGNYNVVLPDYHPGSLGVNTYTVKGVAVDKKGNVSQGETTQVTVTQAAINGTKSTLTPADIILPADGKTQQALVLKVNDMAGLPVDIREDEISLKREVKIRGTSSATISGFKRRAAGEYVAMITAGTMPELFSVTASARDTTFSSASVMMTADVTTARLDSLTLVANEALADGIAQNKIHMRVIDGEGNLVAQQSVNLKADNQANIAKTATTDDKGEAIVVVTSTRAGESLITANIDGKGEQQVSLTFLPDGSSSQISESNMTITPEISIADGRTKKTIAVVVTDKHGNPAADVNVAFSADNSAILGQKEVKTDAKGQASITLTSTVAGNVLVTAQVNNNRTTRSTTFIGNSATALVASVTPQEGPYKADGTTGVMFSALITDKSGNPLPDVAVDWTSDRDSSQVRFNNAQSVTGKDGMAKASITSTRAFPVSVTAFTNSASLTAAPVAFEADSQQGIISQLSISTQAIIANQHDSAELLAKVADKYGNPLSNVDVTWSADLGAEVSTSTPKTDQEGVARATVVADRAGSFTINAALKNGQTKGTVVKAMADAQTASVVVASSAEDTMVGDPDGITLTATAIDELGNPVADTSIAWRATRNTLASDVSMTDKNGKATVKLSGVVSGETTVTAVLYNGNTGTKNIVFTPAVPVSEHSELTVTPQSVTADGTTQATATLTLRDAWDNLVPRQQVAFKSDENTIAFTTVKDNGDGTYQTLVTGKKEGTWTLTAHSQSVSRSTVIGLLANATSSVVESVSVVGTDTAKADGKEKVILRAQVKDKNGNTQLPGVAVGWQATGGVLSVPVSKTNAYGVAEMTLTSKQAGQVNVFAVLGGNQPVDADKVVTFTAGAVATERSTIAISPSTIVADKERAIVRVAVNDAEGNPLSGLEKAITLSYSTDLAMETAVFSQKTPGVYEAQITGRKVGTTNVTALVNAAAIKQRATLVLKADDSSAKVNGQIAVTPTSATVGQSVTYTATLVDKNGNLLGAGIPVTWSANKGSQLASQVTLSDKAGKARVSLTRLLAGMAEVRVILPSGETLAPKVEFNADSADESHSELTLAPAAIVAGQEVAILSLVLKDKNGNLLVKQSVEGLSDNNTVTIAKSKEEKAGYYTLVATGNRAGKAILSVKVNGVTFKQTKSLVVKGDTSSWSIDQVTADKSSFIAGDNNGVTYRASVVDSYGNKLQGVVVSWQLIGQADSFMPTSRTDAEGIATTTVKSRTAGKLAMSAYLDEKNHRDAAVVEVKAAAIDGGKSTFSADKAKIGSDGKEASTLTVTLKDSYGNAITGKTVSFEGASALEGFTVSKVTGNDDGTYRAQATATNKGKVLLMAKADGKTIGNKIEVTVGAIMPDLKFDNVLQQEVYTKRFNRSQVVKGMPAGVAQMWSSSDAAVATVDKTTGKVTLLKAGEAKITVYTPGNAQYEPALASYMLTVDKAAPGINVDNGKPISAVWADGKIYSIAPSFNNNDVGTALTPAYRSEDPKIVTTGKDGKLTAVKPGTALVTISTSETEQFKAEKLNVTYVLAKANIDLSFSKAEEQYRFDDKVEVQPLKKEIPKDAGGYLQWNSSDNTVVTINNGIINGVKPGKSQITVRVTANDFYEQSSSSYHISVFDKPSVSTGLQATELGRRVVLSGSWKPVYNDDTLIFTWVANMGNGTSPINSAKIELVNSSGYTVESKSLNAGELAKGKGEVKFSNSRNRFGEKFSVRSDWEGKLGLASKGQEQRATTYPAGPETLYTLQYRVAQQLWHHGDAVGATTGHRTTGHCTGSDWAMLRLGYTMGFKGIESKYLSEYKDPSIKISFTKRSGIGAITIGHPEYYSNKTKEVDTSQYQSHPTYRIMANCRHANSSVNDGYYTPTVSIRNYGGITDVEVPTEFKWNNGWNANNGEGWVHQDWSTVKVW
ncbi:Ig-like domain-containing protein [Serratia silvae]|uniref:Intimin n=1 Tax=Serratia silvae TaxID=2824122 RepID=A0ABT0K9V9_9GAMM|nr:Ig-like domain-containing protein [Serratia silvae]MCL1028805.1 Ig-like domain-containing protein [Serratia silvae]